MIQLAGHLTADTVRQNLAQIELPSQGGVALVVDCMEMSGYDPEARDAFVEWNAKNRQRVRRVAVVTNRPMWHLVVTAMGVSSKQRMKAFDDMASAEAWAREDDERAERDSEASSG